MGWMMKKKAKEEKKKATLRDIAYEKPYGLNYDWMHYYPPCQPLDPRETHGRREAAYILSMELLDPDYMYHERRRYPRIRVKYMCPYCRTEFTMVTEHSHLFEQGRYIDCICGIEMLLSYRHAYPEPPPISRQYGPKVLKTANNENRQEKTMKSVIKL